MKRFFLTGLTVFTVAQFGCELTGTPGSGVPKTESRQLATFDEVEFNGVGTVEITIGQPQSLEITADDNLIDLITTEVIDRRLVVRMTKRLRPKVGVLVKATVADIKGLVLNGAGEATLKGVNNDRLQITVSGASEVTADGRTSNLQIAVAGAGDIQTAALQARNVSVDIAGAGSADVNASDNLNVSIAGAGDVRYTGNPKITKAIAGAGSLAKKE